MAESSARYAWPPTPFGAFQDNQILPAAVELDTLHAPLLTEGTHLRASIEDHRLTNDASIQQHVP